MSFTKLSMYALAATFVATSTLVFADEGLEEAELFIELNDTDHDFGIHGFADGDEWKELGIENPSGHEILDVDANGALKYQGLTELFFESAEPCLEFDEEDCPDPFDPDVFFDRFPQGWYQIEAVTLEGDELENKVYLSHVIPAAPDWEAVTVNGYPAAEDCDAEDLPKVEAPVTLKWDAVTESHRKKHGDEGLGKNGALDIRYYEVVVEIDESDFKTTAIVPADATEWTFSEDFFSFSDEDEYKFEILVRVNTKHGNPGNKTAMESCFIVE